MTVYAQPGTEGSKVTFKDRYENWIGGDGSPGRGQYFETYPVTGKAFCEVARGTAEDIELALDAAHEVRRPGQDRRRERPRSEQDRRPDR